MEVRRHPLQLFLLRIDSGRSSWDLGPRPRAHLLLPVLGCKQWRKDKGL